MYFGPHVVRHTRALTISTQDERSIKNADGKWGSLRQQIKASARSWLQWWKQVDEKYGPPHAPPRPNQHGDHYEDPYGHAPFSRNRRGVASPDLNGSSLRASRMPEQTDELPMSVPPNAYGKDTRTMPLAPATPLSDELPRFHAEPSAPTL